MTGAVHLLFGASPGLDLGFSSPHSGTGAGGVGGVSAASGPTAAGGGGGEPNGGGNGGGGGGGLPFTGLAVGVLAAVGSALTAGGVALRRIVRRRRA
jgi:hypothetical protein